MKIRKLFQWIAQMSFLLFLLLSQVSRCSIYLKNSVDNAMNKNSKLLENENYELSGIYTNPIVFPSSFQSIRVFNSFFIGCTNMESNGGAIAINSQSFKPKMIVQSSTFFNCSDLCYNGEGGAIYFQGSLFQLTESCFSSCLSSKGLFYSLHMDKNYSCEINLSSLHSNSRIHIGDGVGSIIISGEHYFSTDCNYTNNTILDQGAGAFIQVSLNLFISRNNFQDCTGKSIIYLNNFPKKFNFQLTNFISNNESGNGIISSLGETSFSDLLFYRNFQYIIKSRSGTPFFYRCIFDLSSYINHSLVKLEDEIYYTNNASTPDLFGINILNTAACPATLNGGNINNIYTPSKTPYFDDFFINTVDYLTFLFYILCGILLLALFIVFISFCCCSRPMLFKSLKILKSLKINSAQSSLLSSSSNGDNALPENMQPLLTNSSSEKGVHTKQSTYNEPETASYNDDDDTSDHTFRLFNKSSAPTSEQFHSKNLHSPSDNEKNDSDNAKDQDDAISQNSGRSSVKESKSLQSSDEGSL